MRIKKAARERHRKLSMSDINHTGIKLHRQKFCHVYCARQDKSMPQRKHQCGDWPMVSKDTHSRNQQALDFLHSLGQFHLCSVARVLNSDEHVKILV